MTDSTKVQILRTQSPKMRVEEDRFFRIRHHKYRMVQKEDERV
jgi:hypothetical protein